MKTYKAALLKAKDSDTHRDRPKRGCAGASAEKPHEPRICPAGKRRCRQDGAGKYTLGSLRRAVFEGDTTTGSLMAGQVAGMLHEVRPVADILADLWNSGRQRIAALSTEC